MILTLLLPEWKGFCSTANRIFFRNSLSSTQICFWQQDNKLPHPVAGR